jgi:hypothetical protein
VSGSPTTDVGLANSPSSERQALILDLFKHLKDKRNHKCNPALHLTFVPPRLCLCLVCPGQDPSLVPFQLPKSSLSAPSCGQLLILEFSLAYLKLMLLQALQHTYLPLYSLLLLLYQHLFLLLLLHASVALLLGFAISSC